VAEEKLIIDLWDVGQGDGTVIRLPDNKLIIIDIGPKNSPIIDWLGDQSRGIHAVVISHNDNDHAGGLPSLVKIPNMSIGTVYMLVDRDKQSERFQKLWGPVREEHAKNRFKVVPLIADTVIWQSGNICVKIIYPNFVQNIDAKNPNETCGIVCLLHKDEFKIIWSGDAPMQVVSDKCAGSKPFLLNGPHHGAPTDRKNPQFPKWVEGFKPERIFVSVGSANMHGHPAAAYLKLHVQRSCLLTCTQLTKLCDNHHINNQKPVMQTAALLGLRPARSGVSCRGCLRLTMNTDGLILADRWDHDHLERVKLLRRPKCLI
jgi:beta-lactamase superfamily II metal-dependent hydrolase